MYQFSPSTGGFYVEAMHGDAMPADVVAVSAVRHGELMAAQSAGAQIIAGPDGAPIAQDPPAPVLPTRWYVPVPTMRERLEVAGKWAAVVTLLATDTVKMITVLTLREGVASDDAEARALLTAAGADPDAILAR